MSISLATKGIIFQVGLGGSGTNVYVPITKPVSSTEVIGDIDIYAVSAHNKIDVEITKPILDIKDFKPIIKAE
jgi:alpha-tubulin suppressor-like RCC1 family protein